MADRGLQVIPSVMDERDQSLSPFRVEYSPTCGRHAIVTAPIKAGTCFLVEPPMFIVLEDNFSTYYCAACSGRLQDNSTISCEGCGRIFYCNEACKLKDASLHRCECRAMANESDNMKDDIDERALIRILTMLVDEARSGFSGPPLPVVPLVPPPAAQLSPAARMKSWGEQYTDLIDHCLFVGKTP